MDGPEPEHYSPPNGAIFLGEITAVTFDLWQTLIVDSRGLGSARTQLRLDGTRQALARFGEEYGLDAIRDAYDCCYKQCRQIRLDHLDVSFSQQVGMFLDNISAGLTQRLDRDTLDEVARVYADSFLVHPPAVHEDALAVLGDLKAMGLALGLISNTGMTPGATFRSFMQSQGMLEYFDVLTFSDEVKLAKPSQEIFLLTLGAMGVSPPETAHVGDDPVNDVAGAKGCGLKTVWVTGSYDGEIPTDADSKPDATVAELGMVMQVIAELAGTPVPG